MLNRRWFLQAVSAGFFMAPRVADAQQTGKAPRLGWLTSSVVHEPNLRAFKDGMRALGYGDVAMEFRAAAGHTDRLPALANELVRLKVDAVVVDGGPAALVARQAIADIPVVVGAMADPVGQGIVASLGRPGGNITGFTITTGHELDGKRLDLLAEAAANLARVAVVWNDTNQISKSALEQVTVAAKTRGIDVLPLGVHDRLSVGRAFADAARARVSGLLTLPDAFLWSERHNVVALASRHKLPVIYPEPEFALAGGLLAYGTNVPDNFRRAATYVDKILKGTKPADLPVEQPTKFELVINLKAAKALGFTIPPSLLLRADQIIE
jgi:putative tryptophan/tyrosine transport system substrate-binding protein